MTSREHRAFPDTHDGSEVRHPARRASNRASHDRRRDTARDFSQALIARGVYAVNFSFPVVPRGTARIRTQMCSPQWVSIASVSMQHPITGEGLIDTDRGTEAGVRPRLQDESRGRPGCSTRRQSSRAVEMRRLGIVRIERLEPRPPTLRYATFDSKTVPHSREIASANSSSGRWASERLRPFDPTAQERTAHACNPQDLLVNRCNCCCCTQPRPGRHDNSSPCTQTLRRAAALERDCVQFALRATQPNNSTQLGPQW